MSYNKIPVQVLGATGLVGKEIVKRLNNHPYFELKYLSASERSSGKLYKDIATEFSNSSIGNKKISCCEPTEANIVFSALPSTFAKEIEYRFYRAGKWVISNSSCFRLNDPGILVIPEIRSTVIDVNKLKIITNPNCCVSGIALALAPILQNWNAVHLELVTQQAVSGAGKRGLSSFDITDNIIPYISQEEEKIENELKLIFSAFQTPASWKIKTTCTRVPVLNGHLVHLSLKLQEKTSKSEIIEKWSNFSFNYPTSEIKQPVCYDVNQYFPQPRLHRDLGEGMQVSIGRLREDDPYSFRFCLLVNNLIRGAAGSTLLNGEILYRNLTSVTAANV